MIRPAKANELSQILAWHFRHVDVSSGGREQYAKKFPHEYNAIMNTLCGKSGFVLIAENNKKPVGYIGMTIVTTGNSCQSKVCGFYVEPPHRRKGYGRSLAQEAIVMARQRGIESLSVEVGLKKPWLIEFYKSVGFVPSGMIMYQKLE